MDSYMAMMGYRELDISHHGIKGQRWGVRRFQNKDGTLTSEGKERYRSLKIATSTNAAEQNSIYKTLSLDDKKKLMGYDKNSTKTPDQNFTTDDELNSANHIKSFVAKFNDIPVSSFGVWSEGDNEAHVSIMTRSDYRGKGYGSSAVKRGIKWLDNNPNIMAVYWDVRKDNIPSISLAKKFGFVKMEGENVKRPEWTSYKKTYDNKNARDIKHSSIHIGSGYLQHYGIKGQKWGQRRFQNPDGTLTEEGKRRYYNSDGTLTEAGKKVRDRFYESAGKAYSKTQVRGDWSELRGSHIKKLESMKGRLYEETGAASAQERANKAGWELSNLGVLTKLFNGKAAKQKRSEYDKASNESSKAYQNFMDRMQVEADTYINSLPKKSRESGKAYVYGMLFDW